MTTDAAPDPASPRAQLVAGDLITDLALREGDSDEFDYAGLADRIADLACEGEPPLSIAIFGPWGSGKSSIAELIRRSLDSRENKPGFVRYDAWRYGGAALRRNFIAHAARELRVPDNERYHEFHRGLFENRRVAEISRVHLFGALTTAFKLVPVLIALALVLLGLLWITDLTVYDKALDHTKGVLLGGSLIVGGALFVAKFLADAGRIEIDQSKPSEDDQFSATFDKLVDTVTGPSHAPTLPQRAAATTRGVALRTTSHPRVSQAMRAWREPSEEPRPMVICDRIVFFIDELDRCREEDVVATLNAVRTFLDVKRCVFIVAADRDVIEQALSNVDQAKPLNPVDPYYSTASAFLDKIFHHQIVLPPMRGPRLTRWAQNVARRQPGGLWAELANRGTDAANLDEVLYRLIPSHVRSPRRVKVLLNAFATNVRIAQTRLPHAWPDQVLTLARLTALQVEFRNFASDLRQEPRLPRFVLTDEHRPESDLIDTLVKRWRHDSANPADPDTFIEEGDGEESANDRDRNVRLDEARKQRRLQLLRFLERTADTPDIPRSLLYLNSTGGEAGVEDPQLGELVEREATDSPEAITEALRDRSIDEQRAVAKQLANMVEEVLRPERRNVMTALMDVSERLGDDAQPIAGEISDSLRAYRVANDLEPRHIPGALSIVLVADETDFQLALQLLEADELWNDKQRFQSVLLMSNKFSSAMLETVRHRLESIAATWPEIVIDAARIIDERTGPLLLDREVIEAFVAGATEGAETSDAEDGEEESTTRIAALLQSLCTDSRSKLSRHILDHLFRADPEATETVLATMHDEFLPRLDDDDRGEVLLTAWEHAPRERWGQWGHLIASQTSTNHSPTAERILRRLLTVAPTLSATELAEVDRLQSILARRIDIATLDPGPTLAPISAALEEDTGWHTDDDAGKKRVALHNLLYRLGSDVSTLADASETLRLNDIHTGLTQVPTAAAARLATVRSVTPLLSPESIDLLLDDLPDWSVEEDGGLRARWLWAELLLRHHASTIDVSAIRARSKDIYVAAGRYVTGHPGWLSSASAEAIALWLAAEPTAQQVATLMRRLGERRHDAVDHALAEWAQREGLTEKRRAKANTKVAETLLSLKLNASSRMQALATGGLFESSLVSRARETLLDRTTSIDERVGVAATLAAVAPRSQSARTHVARLARDLIDRRLYRNDLDTVVALMPALQDDYRGASVLERSIESWLEHYKTKLTADQAMAIARAGIRIDDSVLSRNARRAVGTVIEAAADAAGWLARRFM